MKRKSFFNDIKNKIEKQNELIVGFILFLVFFVLFFVDYDVTEAKGDIAEYVNNPLRIINGDYPYRDFWLLFPPGEVYFPYLIYKIFGLKINYVFISSLVISALIPVVGFFIGKLLCKSNSSGILTSVLIFFNGLPVMYVGPIYNYIYFLLIILSFYFFANYLNNKKFSNVFLSALFISSSLFFRLYETFAALASLFIIILFMLFEKQISKKIFLENFFIFLTFLFMIFLFYFIFFAKILNFMIKEVLIESVGHISSERKLYFDASFRHFNFYLKYIQDLKIFQAFFHFFGFLRSTILYLLPFIMFFVIVSSLRKIKSPYEKFIVLMFFLWGFFTLPKAVLGGDMSHLGSSTTQLLIPLVFFTKNLDKKMKRLLIVIIIIVLLSIPSFFLKKFLNLTAVHYKISTDYGYILLNDKNVAESVNKTIKFILNFTDKNDYIFVTSYDSPPIYVLTNRKNPTYYDSLVDVTSRPTLEKQNKICSDLITKNTKLIIYSDFYLDDIKNVSFSQKCKILEKCIKENFHLIEKYGNIEIYISNETKYLLN